ncbi:MAG: DUF4446 family protein [Chloroflexota bacterium]|nr:MAG: DUF4446 family protein [Chloroflexota bacterium]
MRDLSSLFLDYGPALWLALLGGFIALVVLHLQLMARVNRMLLQYQRLTRGGGGGNLEEVLDRHLASAERTAERVDELDRANQEIAATLRRAVQNVGLVRFNPFHDTGGDQSFSIALLDGSNDGIVVSSLFSRSETRVFAKAVQDGNSKYKLTDEEIQAIRLATDSGEDD